MASLTSYRVPQYGSVRQPKILPTSHTPYSQQSRTIVTFFNWNSKLPGIRVLLSKTDYILVSYPKEMSYMVGLGEKYPQKIHHRGSSLPSFQQKSQHFACGDAFQSYYDSAEPYPNILIGALVGGSDHNDELKDDIDNLAQAEPAKDINAPLVGTFMFLAANF